MEKLRALIVESNITYKKFFTETVNSTSFAIVEQSVSDVEIMFSWLSQSTIDVVLIDADLLSKRDMDIFKRLMQEYPKVEIVVLGSANSGNTGITDYIVKPNEDNLVKNIAVIRNQLQAIFAQIKVKGLTSQVPAITDAPLPVEAEKSGSTGKEVMDKIAKEGIDLILIASSTGGPMALDKVFQHIPADLSTPVLIVQHLPSGFTKALAQKLDDKLAQEVREGRDGDLIQQSQIIIAPGDRHMTVYRSTGGNKQIRLLDTPLVNGVRPSADVLFCSAADAYRDKNILAIILTGMGNDGERGILELKQKCNCYCITQSEASCVVYGMPKCVYEAGLSNEVVDLEALGYRINQISRQGRR